MSNEQMQDFDLGFTAEQYEQLRPEDGVGFRRIAVGDYTFEVTGTKLQEAKNKEKPHNMLVITARVVGVVEGGGGSKDEIGSEITTFYAGSPQSPDFMQKRLKNICEATGVTPPLKGSKFLGKRFDASIVWELSESNKLDEMGRKKVYANDRLKAERKTGQARPQGFNPAAESAKAMEFVTKGSTTGAPIDAPEWEQNDIASTAGANAAPGFIPEEQVDEMGHTYRAAWKIGGEGADAYRDQLIAAGIDPEGPVDVSKVTHDEVKAAYLKAFPPAAPAQAKGPALPPLGGKPAGNARTGVRQPRA